MMHIEMINQRFLKWQMRLSNVMVTADEDRVLRAAEQRSTRISKWNDSEN